MAIIRTVLEIWNANYQSWTILQFSSVQFSHSVMSISLRPHESQHARPPCPSTTPRVHPNPCPLSRWCHPAISSSVAPFSSCLQSPPASGSFPVSRLFASGGQSIGGKCRTRLLPLTRTWKPLSSVLGDIRGHIKHVAQVWPVHRLFSEEKVGSGLCMFMQPSRSWRDALLSRQSWDACSENLYKYKHPAFFSVFQQECWVKWVNLPCYQK